MSRSIHGGIACLLVTLFLAGNVGEAAGLHECPHHHAGAATTEAGHAGDPHGDPAGSHEDGASPPGACTCIGTCHGEAGIGLPAGAITASVVPVGLPLAMGSSVASRDLHSTPYLLPYATGPPAA